MTMTMTMRCMKLWDVWNYADRRIDLRICNGWIHHEWEVNWHATQWWSGKGREYDSEVDWIELSEVKWMNE